VSRQTALIETVGFSELGANTIGPNSVSALTPCHPDRVRPNVYSGLIARLFGADDAPKVVAFVSAHAGEGVRRTITRLADEVVRTTGKRCSTTTASRVIGVSTERAHVAGSPGFSSPLHRKERLADMAADCDVVLVDAGSVAPGGEVLGIAREMDAIVVVVESGKTRRRELNQTISAIVAAGGTIVGLVFYRRRRLLPAWLEGLVS
jgi:hypothetical protein